MPSESVIQDFMAQKRLAFVGVSHDPKSFSASVYRALRERGYQLLPVNPNAEPVEGDPCYASVGELPDGVDGAIVMVTADASASVVEACIARGIPRVWLHKGLGPSSVSDEAVALCHEHGVEVIDGACPMMFAEPVGWFHRVHHSGRRLTHQLTD